MVCAPYQWFLNASVRRVPAHHSSVWKGEAEQVPQETHSHIPTSSSCRLLHLPNAGRRRASILPFLTVSQLWGQLQISQFIKLYIPAPSILTKTLYSEFQMSTLNSMNSVFSDYISSELLKHLKNLFLACSPSLLSRLPMIDNDKVICSFSGSILLFYVTFRCRFNFKKKCEVCTNGIKNSNVTFSHNQQV